MASSLRSEVIDGALPRIRYELIRRPAFQYSAVFAIVAAMGPEAKYQTIIEDMEFRSPAVGPEGRVWRKVLYQGIREAIEGDSEARAWLGTPDCQDVIRLSGFDVKRVLDIWVDRGLMPLGKDRY